MKTKQKFQRGNLVKVLSRKGDLAIIEGSYADLYWGDNRNDYSIIFLDSGGSLAWVDEKNMELVDIGGEYLFKQALDNKDKIIKNYTDMSYIYNNWKSDNPNSFSSATILYLLNRLGFKSSFDRNGEFFALYSDWAELFPLYDALMTKKNFEDIESIFVNDIPSDLKRKIKSLHEEICSIK